MAPVLLAQILVQAPIYLTVQGLASGSKIPWQKRIARRHAPEDRRDARDRLVPGPLPFGLEGKHLLAIVIMGALPTAQNVFLFASPYRRGVIVARDVVLCTTLLCSGSLLVIAWLLG
ncbi:hypothetical protein [Arthrobacter sp. 92]|uniref:hypothetical protein n=1 Tax=Arthrobacter sp. 92 TaxID=3418175 RepID=UPI003D039CBB